MRGYRQVVREILRSNRGNGQAAVKLTGPRSKEGVRCFGGEIGVRLKA